MRILLSLLLLATCAELVPACGEACDDVGMCCREAGGALISGKCVTPSIDMPAGQPDLAHRD